MPTPTPAQLKAAFESLSRFRTLELPPDSAGGRTLFHRGDGVMSDLMRYYIGGLVKNLPELTVLLCPLMHVFMHRGHGGRGGESGSHDPQGGGSRGGSR